MDFNPTDEQKMIRESARKLMEREIVPFLNRFPQDEPMPLPEIKALLKKLIPLGYLGSTIPEAYGGAGLDFLTYGMLLEELEPSIFGLVMLQAGTARSVYLLGDEKQKRTFIPPLISADKVGCSAITEPNVGSNTAAVETRARLEGDQYIINGTKTWITNGAFADMAFVLANADPSKGIKGLCRLIVDKDASPFEARIIPTMGESYPIPGVGELHFEDCSVPRENLLGSAEAGLKDTLTGFQAARCFVALNSINIAQRAINASVKYAKERFQFGKPIGRFQLIQSMLADMISLTDAGRLLAYRALAMVDKGVRCAKETSMAKFFATEAAVKVTSMAVQIHGAYGLSTEYPVEKFFRHARMMTIPDGTTQIQKLVVAREVTGLRAFS